MRNLNKISKFSILELVDYIIEEFHFPIRADLDVLDFYINRISEDIECSEKMVLPKEIFKQFKVEFINHIDEEENNFFPEIINLEKGNLETFSKAKRFLHTQEIEHNEIDNYLIGGRNIINLIKKESDDYTKLKEILDKIYKDTLDHIYIENNYLNTKVNQLINKYE